MTLPDLREDRRSLLMTTVACRTSGSPHSQGLSTCPRCIVDRMSIIVSGLSESIGLLRTTISVSMAFQFTPRSEAKSPSASKCGPNFFSVSSFSVSFAQPDIIARPNGFRLNRNGTPSFGILLFLFTNLRSAAVHLRHAAEEWLPSKTFDFKAKIW